MATMQSYGFDVISYCTCLTLLVMLHVDKMEEKDIKRCKAAVFVVHACAWTKYMKQKHPLYPNV